MPIDRASLPLILLHDRLKAESWPGVSEVQTIVRQALDSPLAGGCILGSEGGRRHKPACISATVRSALCGDSGQPRLRQLPLPPSPCLNSIRGIPTPAPDARKGDRATCLLGETIHSRWETEDQPSGEPCLCSRSARSRMTSLSASFSRHPAGMPASPKYAPASWP